MKTEDTFAITRVTLDRLLDDPVVSELDPTGMKKRLLEAVAARTGKSKFDDAWGRPIEISIQKQDTERLELLLKSRGRDGRSGTADDVVWIFYFCHGDVVNWWNNATKVPHK